MERKMTRRNLLQATAAGTVAATVARQTSVSAGVFQPVKIEEDDEQFTITGHPCGSGERLIRDGGYEPPRNFLKIQEPQPMTFNRVDFPVYCAHCYFQNLARIEPEGAPLFVTEPPSELGKKPCRVYMYK